jgi:class 3 adenylate cyclase
LSKAIIGHRPRRYLDALKAGTHQATVHAGAGHDIGFRIGIAHEFATLGIIGFEGRLDCAVVGPVANVAFRLAMKRSRSKS